MCYLFKGGTIYADGAFKREDVLVKDDLISQIGDIVQCDTAQIIDCRGKYVFPSFIDVHVHLREPGFSYKETIKTGTMAAAHGGFGDVLCMPNLNPAPDSPKHLKILTDLICRDSKIGVHPYGTITVGEKGRELSQMEELSANVVGFSDDGRGIQNGEQMRDAMKIAKKTNKIIAAHCEDNSLLFGDCIHDGEYAKKLGYPGICSKSEWLPIKRDLSLAKETGCKYHVCHISCAESVQLIRNAKLAGIDVTCETAPHYLSFCDEDLIDEGRFKMNPPIRSKEDQEALIAGIVDGTIDMIATDHAPHSKEEKSKGLKGSLMGVVGLEASFAVCYTDLVCTGKISLERLLELFHDNPMKRFSVGNNICAGEKAKLTVFDLDMNYKIDSDDFLSMGKATPYLGKTVSGKCCLTMYNGKIIWNGSVI